MFCTFKEMKSTRLAISIILLLAVFQGCDSPTQKTNSSTVEATRKSTSANNYKEQIIATLKETALHKAKAALQEAPVTVTADSSSRSTGGLHDFFSEGDYWWPDEENPEGPYIRKDGMTNPDNFTAHRESLLRFSELVGNLTSAYILTNDDAYAKAALDHCHAWFIEASTKMNPNLLYAQAIKGRHTGRGIGIIDAIHFMEVVRSLMILEKMSQVGSADMVSYRNWFSDFVIWLTTHPYGLKEMVHPNNHSTCWNMQVGLYAVFTKNEKVISACRERFMQTLLPNQMAADGSFPKELARTKPYGYALFNLDAFVMNSLILSDETGDLWTYSGPDGQSIKQGLSYMHPFVDNKKTWPLDPDVMYWDNWPVAHPSFIFGALQYNRDDYFELWERYDHFPTVFEVRRNLPIRNPLIWLDAFD